MATSRPEGAGNVWFNTWRAVSFEWTTTRHHRRDSRLRAESFCCPVPVLLILFSYSGRHVASRRRAGGDGRAHAAPHIRAGDGVHRACEPVPVSVRSRACNRRHPPPFTLTSPAGRRGRSRHTVTLKDARWSVARLAQGEAGLRAQHARARHLLCQPSAGEADVRGAPCITRVCVSTSVRRFREDTPCRVGETMR